MAIVASAQGKAVIVGAYYACGAARERLLKNKLKLN